jgi:hypothetical protein
MTQKAIFFKFVVPTVSTIVVGIVISTAFVYLTGKYPTPTNQVQARPSVAISRGSAELPYTDERLWRVHVLLR